MTQLIREFYSAVVSSRGFLAFYSACFFHYFYFCNILLHSVNIGFCWHTWSCKRKRNRRKEKNIADSRMHTVFYYPAVLSWSCKPELGHIKIRFTDYALSFRVEVSRVIPRNVRMILLLPIAKRESIFDLHSHTYMECLGIPTYFKRRKHYYVVNSSSN